MSLETLESHLPALRPPAHALSRSDLPGMRLVLLDEGVIGLFGGTEGLGVEGVPRDRADTAQISRKKIVYR